MSVSFEIEHEISGLCDIIRNLCVMPTDCKSWSFVPVVMPYIYLSGK